ncbi:hypothetical protein [Verrucomicrobium spinosum]|uniref:hypothetical protein n=1 Tax=Verrucomicrobium spinosum TaxID=2736 RepID=UPI0012E25245|nr:hypothetical protein [Verrucomicrobium spinosum]
MVAVLATTAVVLSAENYHVHEWGTMTQVAGSDGAPLKWHQPSSDLSGLPGFVGLNLFQAKNLGSALVRMETPVLYFYPQSPLKGTASVTMENGRITEWYPFPASPPTSLTAKVGEPVNLSAPVEWRFELLPPDDKTALGQIPPAPRGRGDHYAHAREVPDAWIVRSTHPTGSTQADKFIFYRGAADLNIPLLVTAPSDTELRLINTYSEPITRAFLLRVENNRASWRKLETLPVAPKDSPTLAIEPPATSVNEAATSLAEAVKQELTSAGLTPAEAAAMVATWKEAWFKEPGTRVLALLPESWVNAVLPLKLSPTPTKVKRVFVARMEVFPPSQEKAVAALLDQAVTERATPALAAAFQKLQMGRFGSAGLERAAAMKRLALQTAFYELQASAQKLQASADDTPPSASSR